ncbi:MAG: 2-C-methyl-D-erythritol 4-phosphate cytidylyltransferase [Desulfuromonadales bacterium]|nr:2-C-methyl-D-erythritol 4-phosphate cytidylyltransferase [Desulfuromonadales bacterium]
MNVHALIPAAGCGRRLGGTVSKQYLALGGQPILALTVQRLAALESVSRLHLIVPPDDLDFCRHELLAPLHIAKPVQLVAGGAERQESVGNGLAACVATDDDLVLIHDGVRPFFPAARIDDLLAAARECGAALLAIPAQDTIKQVVDGRVRQTLDRSTLWQAQTPQAFRYGVLCEAQRRAAADGFRATDDASLVEYCGWPVAVVPGSPHNLKITTPDDLALARALLASDKETPV